MVRIGLDGKMQALGLYFAIKPDSYHIRFYTYFLSVMSFSSHQGTRWPTSTKKAASTRERERDASVSMIATVWRQCMLLLMSYTYTADRTGNKTKKITNTTK